MTMDAYRKRDERPLVGVQSATNWTNLDSYKRTAENRHLWRSCTRVACLPTEATDDEI